MRFYRKNIGGVHQLARIALGMGIAVAAFAYLKDVPAWFVAANGVFFALTGVIGWCPACAMLDRGPKD